MITCKVCGAVVDNTRVSVCPRCNNELTSQYPVDGVQTNANAMVGYAQPMKWFKFIIWFQLFASAIGNLYNGIQYLTGDLYGEATEVMYEVFTSLKTLNTVYGYFCIFIALYAIVTRFMLSGFKSIGPKLLYFLYILLGVTTLVYTLLFQNITNINDDLKGYYYAIRGLSFNIDYISMWIRVAGNLIANLVLICVNFAYFSNRSNLFNK